MSVTWDTSEIGVLNAALDKALRVTPIEARAVVKKGANNVKEDAQRLSRDISHATQYYRTISYESREMPWGGSAEIGPDKDKVTGADPKTGRPYKPGSLGNVLEFGTSNNAPRPHLAPALEIERPKFEAALAAIGSKALGVAAGGIL